VAILPRWRLPLGALATFTAATLLLAGIVHICTILLVPLFAEADGWSRLEPLAGENRFADLGDAPGAASVPGLDPLFLNGACRLRLEVGPASVAVEARDRLWSLALYDPSGTILFSLNDRTALEGRLDMIVADAGQYAELRQAPPFDLDQTIMVESGSQDLIALLRLYAPTAAARSEARRILASAECIPFRPKPGSASAG
jgi:uncharacterized membrane protein